MTVQWEGVCLAGADLILMVGILYSHIPSLSTPGVIPECRSTEHSRVWSTNKTTNKHTKRGRNIY